MTTLLPTTAHMARHLRPRDAAATHYGLTTAHLARRLEVRRKVSARLLPLNLLCRLERLGIALADGVPGVAALRHLVHARVEHLHARVTRRLERRLARSRARVRSRARACLPQMAQIPLE